MDTALLALTVLEDICNIFWCDVSFNQHDCQMIEQISSFISNLILVSIFSSDDDLATFFTYFF